MPGSCGLGLLLDPRRHPRHCSPCTRGVGVPAATPGVSVLYVWKEVIFKWDLTPSFSAAWEGGGEGGGQSRAAPGRLINSG